MRFLILPFFLFSFISGFCQTDGLNMLGLQQVAKQTGGIHSERLMKVFDSIYPTRREQLFSYLSSEKWESILVLHYKNATDKHQSELAFRLSYPLATIYSIRHQFQQSKPLLENLYDKKEMLSASQLGVVLSKLEEVYLNLYNIDLAVKIRDERIQRGLIKTFWQIYQECGMHKEALEDFQLFEEKPSKLNLFRMRYYQNYGTLFLSAGQFDSALAVFNQGYKEAANAHAQKLTMNEDWGSHFKGLIGEVMLKQGRYEESLPLILKDVENWPVDYRIQALLNLNEVYIAKKDFVSYIRYRKELSKYAMQNFRRNELQRLFLLDAKFYEQTGKFQLAANSLKLKDSIDQVIRTTNLQGQDIFLVKDLEIKSRRKQLKLSQEELLISKTEIENRNKVAIILITSFLLLLAAMLVLFSFYREKIKAEESLKKINEELKKDKATIEGQYDHINTLIKELHHRVKNNLQLVNSLLNLQNRRLDDPAMKEVISSIQHRIHSVALVHQNLLMNETIQTVNLSVYVSELISHLHEINQHEIKVNLEFDLEPVFLSPQKAVNLGLVINEIVTNTFKHAFTKKQEGLLQTILKNDGKNCHLIISDNGPGFDQNKLEGSKTIGNLLIVQLCRELKADYQLTTNKKTTHSIKIPI